MKCESLAANISFSRKEQRCWEVTVHCIGFRSCSNTLVRAAIQRDRKIERIEDLFSLKYSSTQCSSHGKPLCGRAAERVAENWSFVSGVIRIFVYMQFGFEWNLVIGSTNRQRQNWDSAVHMEIERFHWHGENSSRNNQNKPQSTQCKTALCAGAFVGKS